MFFYEQAKKHFERKKDHYDEFVSFDNNEDIEKITIQRLVRG